MFGSKQVLQQQAARERIFSTERVRPAFTPDGYEVLVADNGRRTRVLHSTTALWEIDPAEAKQVVMAQGAAWVIQ